MRRLIPLLTFALIAAAPVLRAEPVGFNRDIRPILSENCFHCHGPDKNARMAGLRLDQREAAIEAGAIEPGDTDASKLVARIRAEEPALLMPPAWSDKKLTEEQKSDLVRWIKQGAEYESHWAYIPPRRPEAPEGPAAIDFLVNKKLAANKLEPVGAADRRTLARRLSFDLTGLPPEPETVEAFEQDRGSRAYEKLVDRLLSSPHFGERMAVHWLDLVRYADTTGFHGDQSINVYPFRDYVIGAFNQNKPFNEFTREQLAGDLLPGATQEQRVASAYNRLSRMTNEGGAQAKEYLSKYAADRVRTTSTVWLGSTLGCAECHDHKFDPFWTKDFYSMEAFFADIEEKGVYGGGWGSSLRALPEESQQETKRIDARLKALRQQGRDRLKTSRKNVEKFAGYLRQALQQWNVLEPAEAKKDCSHPDIYFCDNFDVRTEPGGFVQLVRTDKEKPVPNVGYEVQVEPGAGSVTALLLETFASQDCQTFLLSEFEVRRAGSGLTDPMRIRTVVPDWEDPGALLRDTLDNDPYTGWKGNPTDDGTRRALFIFEEPIRLKAGERLQVKTLYSGLPYGMVADRFRLSATDAAFPELPADGDLRAAVTSQGARTKEQQQALETAFRQFTSNNPRWLEIRKLERQEKTLLDHADECLVTKAREEPREIRVLPRGNWMDDSGEIVEPQAPHFLNPIPTNGKRLTRVDLADWLVSRENPLTARVFVNRLWKVLFGTGLSKVLDDVGSQGEPPVNQDLLDWLAVEFMEGGWDVKHVIRTMVLSDTYQRSSEPTPELAKADPYNRLQGRQAVVRLPAELIRDNALAVSGLLNTAMGGRSVKPYQPAGYYKELNFPKREYNVDLNSKQFRRGVYMHWQRTYLHPALMAFDAPSREECAAMRTISNTPLQALTLLNDPTFVEAAKALAARILQSGEANEADRVDLAFRLTFSRPPSAEERGVLMELLRSQRTSFERDPSRAEELLATGITPVPAGLAGTELAAWTSVARALLNKHEFVMRY